MNTFEACLKACKKNSKNSSFTVRTEGNRIIMENDLMVETISFSWLVKSREQQEQEKKEAMERLEQKMGVNLKK